MNNDNTLQDHNTKRVISESGHTAMAVTNPQLEANIHYVFGPEVKQDNGVAEAISSLYYLPMSFKLILPVPADVKPQLVLMFKKMVGDNNALNERVIFIENKTPPESPEAFASMVLSASRV